MGTWPSVGAARRDTPIRKLEASLKCGVMPGRGRSALPARMIRLTDMREISPYPLVHSHGDKQTEPKPGPAHLLVTRSGAVSGPRGQGADVTRYITAANASGSLHGPRLGRLGGLEQGCVLGHTSCGHRITGTVGKAGFDLNQAGDRAMTGGKAPMREAICGSARCRPQPQVGHISGHFDATDNLRPLSNIHRWQGAPRSRRQRQAPHSAAVVRMRHFRLQNA
jgi:hypothetical protein